MDLLVTLCVRLVFSKTLHKNNVMPTNLNLSNTAS